MRNNTQYDYGLYDIEDDAIDRGDATNQSESFQHFNIEDIELPAEEIAIQYAQDVAESEYHNEYYLGNRQWGNREIKVTNKRFHELNTF